MSNQMMSLNTEVVGATINQISNLTADIQTRNKKFLELLQEKNAFTKGKFDLLVALEQGIVKESQNFDALIEAQEDIKEALRQYTELIEEANDASQLRVD